MNSYFLYIKVADEWVQVGVIVAISHKKALVDAADYLLPEHCDKPIRLQQEDRQHSPTLSK